MRLVCLIFDGVTLLDAAGPVEVLCRLPGATVHWVAPKAGVVTTAESNARLHADFDLAHAPEAEIVLVPGGPGVRALLHDDSVLEWLCRAHAASRFTTSVCTGSLLLGAAGLLRGKRATTHWNAVEELRSYGTSPVNERVVVEGKLVMGAGVSAGIDLALTLAALVADEEMARAIQLSIEYDPAPPFDCGALNKASASVVALARNRRARRANPR